MPDADNPEAPKKRWLPKPVRVWIFLFLVWIVVSFLSMVFLELRWEGNYLMRDGPRPEGCFLIFFPPIFVGLAYWSYQKFVK
jgi:hypothetical protein